LLGSPVGAFKTTNGGSSWTAINNGLTGAQGPLALAVDPITPTTVYAGLNGAVGVFKSIDGGGSWTPTNLGPNFVDALAIDPVTPTTLYAGTAVNGVLKSTDAGGSWTAMNNGLPGIGPPIGNQVFVLAVDRATPPTLYIGTSLGAFKSTNGGGNWAAINNGLSSPSAHTCGGGLPQGTPCVFVLAIDRVTPTTLYAGTNADGVFKSTDGGGSWTTINNGLTNARVQALAIDPANPTTLYAGTGGGGVFKSSDGGLSWTSINSGLTNTDVSSLVIDPATPTTVYAGTFGGGVFILRQAPPPPPTWTQKCPAATPLGRYAHGLAYDAPRGQVVMFGGGDANTAFNDTWVWDGTNWTQILPATSPPATSSHAMAYDAARQQIVKFGGAVGGTIVADTWVWDGVNWAQKFPINSPSPRLHAGMAYDATRQQIVLFGGGPGSPTAFADTWVWDGTNWTQKFPSTSPPPRSGHRMAFDTVRGEVVLFGGTVNAITTFFNDTWVWDGTNWTQKFPATSPTTPRFHFGLAYDAAQQGVVLFGGQGPNNTPLYSDTWAWDGTTWTQQLPTTRPAGRSLPGMAYDEARSQIVLFGGFAGSFTNETWLWGPPNPTTCPIGPPPTHTLTVASTNPNSGVPIRVSLLDNNNLSDGTTQFARTYNDGATVTLNAPSPAVGNNFSNWTSCDSTSGTNCTVTMNADRTVTANYVTPLPVTHTLTVSSTNPGSGVPIVVSPADANAQGNGTTQFTRTYNNGVLVTLSAPATAGGNFFSSWTGCDSASGATCTLTMNADRTARANYVTPPPVTCPPPTSANPKGAICSIDDTFLPASGTVTYLNGRLWRFENNDPLGIVLFTSTPTGFKPTGAQVTAPVGAAGRGIFSVCSATSDFDVRVDYKLSGVLFPYEVRLGAIQLGTGLFGEVGIHRNSTAAGSDFYTMVFADRNTPPLSTNETSGTLRLQRSGCATATGCILKAFKRSPPCGDIGDSTCPATDPAWVQVGPTEAITSAMTQFNLDVATTNPTGSGRLMASFTNFKITGTISCPSVSTQAAGRAQDVLLARPIAVGCTAQVQDGKSWPPTECSTPYNEGGKGFSYVETAGASTVAQCAASILGCDHYIAAQDLPNQYWFASLQQQNGTDCSGLVMWSYNKAAGATTKFRDANPIQYDWSEDQYLYNSTPLSAVGDLQPPGDLQPGDLLFFNYAHPNIDVDHVAMYVGPTSRRPLGEIIEAYNETHGVISSNCSLLKSPPTCERAGKDPFNASFSFVGYRRPLQLPLVSLAFVTHSPISLVVSDPDGFTIDANTVVVTEREVMHLIPGQLSYIQDSNGDDTVLAPTLKPGNYFVKVVPKPGASPRQTYSLTVQTTDGINILADSVPIASIPDLGYGIESTGTTIRIFIPVAIDIKPGELPNSINPRSQGKIPVVVLSSGTFNAASRIDQSSLTFGRTGDESSLARCNNEDVNGDGLLDLVCQFNTPSTGFVSGDTVGVLKGRTVDGTLVRGTDSVVIVTQ